MCDGWNSLRGSVRLCFWSSWLDLSMGCPGLGAGSNDQFIHPSDKYLLNISHVLSMVLQAVDSRVNKSSHHRGACICIPFSRHLLDAENVLCFWHTEANKNEKNGSPVVKISPSNIASVLCFGFVFFFFGHEACRISAPQLGESLKFLCKLHCLHPSHDLAPCTC